MRQHTLPRDSGLTARMTFTMFLLAAVYLAFVMVLWQAGVNYIFIAVFAGGMLLVQYFFSDKLVLASIGAHQVSPEQEPRLHGIVERLAAQFNLPKPKVAVIQSNVPNALATGRNPKNAVVAVTTGIMDKLTEPELEGVIAHELTHVKNRDVAVITLASFCATRASFIVQMGVWFGLGMGGGRRDDREGGASAVVLVYLVSILVWIISFFLIRALSRYRELAADRGAAIITGAPSQLASALVKISGSMARIPDTDLRKVEGASALMIIPAISRGSFAGIFSTHPSLKERIEQLRRLEAAMEGA
ncbi:MAG: zinc metalloprotease HtpX [Chloroflexi bacterium]|nr:zinc metalloprotease HtpX [Chloroflexota bacterium]